MRSIALWTLLSLGPLGVFAGVIPDISKVVCTDTAVSSSALPEITECIKDICSSETAGAKSSPCGLTTLSISATPSDIHACVDHFSSIIKQCISPEGIVKGGFSIAHGAEYKITIEASQSETIEKRQKKKKGKTTVPKTQPKPKQPAKPDPKNNKDLTKTDPKDNKDPAKADPKKKNPSKTTAKPSPTTSKPTKTAVSSSDCPIPLYKPNGKPAGKIYKEEPKLKGSPKPTKGKGKTALKTGKAARDVSEDFVTEVEKRQSGRGSSSPSGSGSGSGSGGGSCTNLDRWYRVTELIPGKATWWRYYKKRGWENIDRRRAAYQMIRDMPRTGGKLDVIRIKRGVVSFGGSQQGEGTRTPSYAKSAGSYLLTNGGFFVMNGAVGTRPEDTFKSIGETSINSHTYPIPELYAQYYRRLEGDDDTFIHTGPSLKTDIPLNRPEFVYNTENAIIPGSLAHASQPNERVAIAKLSNGDRYVFAYTADSRHNGVSVNQLGDLIVDFFDIYMGMTINQAQVVMNLDGGGSVYVSWNSAGKEWIIAQGGNGDGTPGNEAGHARRVANVMKVFTR